MFNTQWYALHTRKGSEKKVVDALVKNELESYYPLNYIYYNAGGKNKIVKQPLFSSFLFVRVNENERETLKIIPGVLSMMYWLKEPAIFTDVEIEMIRRFLQTHVNVQLEKTAVNMSERARLTSGILTERDNENLAISSGQEQLDLPSLGFILSAKVENEKVEVTKERITFQMRMLRPWRLV